MWDEIDPGHSLGYTEILKELPKAILCEYDEEEIWIPKSQIHPDSEVWEVGDEGDIVVRCWYAKRKGWI